MIKFLFLLLIISLFCLNISTAQLSGTKNIPGNYATLAAAINDLNIQGVGAGGVVLNLLTGNPQTAPPGGFVITASGTVYDSITFKGNSNIITASPSQTPGAINDAIFKIIGADYVAITNFILQENALNTVTAVGTNNMTEFGVALFYSTPTNGANNNIISFNTISLNRIYANSFAIYSNTRHTAANVTAIADITSPAGSNSNNKIYGNTISNVNSGITFLGCGLTLMDTGNDVGGSSLLQGNTITNWGGAAATGSYASLSLFSINYCILMANEMSYNVSFNTIVSAAVIPSAPFNGIFQLDISTGTVDSYTNNITNNNITMTSGAVSGSLQAINAVNKYNSTTLNINSNSIKNCIISGVNANYDLVCIKSMGIPGALVINSNIIKGNSSSATTGGFKAILFEGADSAIEVQANQIGTASDAAITFTAVNSSASYFISSSSSGILQELTIFANTFQGIVYQQLSPASNYYIYNTLKTNSGITEINSNIFKDLDINITGNVNFITTVDAAVSLLYINVNTIENTFKSKSVGTVSFINVIGTVNSGAIFISTNNFSSVTISGNANISCISILSDCYKDASGNTISNISGAGDITGISLSGTGRIYVNKICDLESSSPGAYVTGIELVNGELDIYNNLVGSLRCPSANNLNPRPSITGIYAGNGIQHNISYNTIYLDAISSGINFSSASFYSSASVNINLRNNIFVNLSAPKGTGISASFKRNGAAINNYISSLSNNNLFYAGAPGTSHLIYYDGTNSDMTLTGFKTRMSPADSSSVTESPAFLSTAGSSSNYLHLNNAVPTLCESGGIYLSWETITDYDGDLRDSVPDIGADEINGIKIQYTSIIITVAIEGFYNSSSDSHIIYDNMRAYLRNSVTPYNIIDSSQGVINSSSLSGSFHFFNVTSAGNYYLEIKHRNTIETWSKNPIAITPGSIYNYDFTTSAAKAYGNNLVQVDNSPVRFAIYSGDVTQDGIVNLTDMILTYNDAVSFVSGYNNTDLNGDNVTNLTDIIIANNNTTKFVTRFRP